jgi:hypothetical protein
MTSKKKEEFIIEIQKKVIFEGIHCTRDCDFKGFNKFAREGCTLFNEMTRYNIKLDKPKRVKKCLKYF